MLAQDVILNYIENAIARNSGKPIDIPCDVDIEGVPDAVVDDTIRELEARGRIQIWKQHEGSDGGERVCSFYGISIRKV